MPFPPRTAKGCAAWSIWRWSRFPSRKRTRRNPTAVRVAIVGRPNVGKSTLINTLLGEERVIAFDTAGNDARCDRDRFRARRPQICACRYGRHAQARQGVRVDREVLGGQDPAGDRGRQRRHPDGRCPGRCFRAGCAHRRFHRGVRPRAGGRGQQVGRARSLCPRADPRRSSSAS